MNNVQFIISGEEPCKKRLLTVNLLTPEKKGGCQKRTPARRPGGFEIRRKKKFDLLKPGIYNPPT